MRVGVVILPEHRWPEARVLWRRAEELGFAHAWTYDHLAWRDLRDGPWFATVPTLAAAALATEHIRLGTLVASPNFRHPVPFAKEAMTLDDLSGGRLTLGIGAGGTGWDATMLGQDPLSPGARAERFEEFVSGLDRLLSEPRVSFSGRAFAADEARTVPGCVQSPRVPFVLAATGRRGMGLVARHGQGWVTFGDPRRTELLGPADGVAVVRAQLSLLEEACAAAGRDPAGVERVVLTGVCLDPGLGSVEQFRDTAGRYAEAGVTELVVHWPRPTPPFAGDPGVFETVFGG